ncbi:MAG: lytic murein transglycosylase, partial [Pseudomonadales bacterium]|nr:lytic murein transglycosylase [Pseudomonadales bacterium]
MLKRFFLLLIVLPAWADGPGHYANRDEVRQFAEEFVESHGTYTVDELLSLFEKAKYKQQIIDAISRPAEKTLNWDEYQDIFLTRRRVSEGRRFMNRYRDALEDAREKFGVPPAVITSVIGVETMYGGNRGSFRVIDAMSTLAFAYRPHSYTFRPAADRRPCVERGLRG